MTLNDRTFILADKLRDSLRDIILGTKVQSGSEQPVEVFLNERLPQIVALAQSVLADGRINFIELYEIVRFVSTNVRDGLDIYAKTNTEDKLIVVREIIQFLVKELLPRDSAVKRFILDDANLGGVITLVYQLAVKLRR